MFAFARKLDSVAPVRLGVLTKAERGYKLTGPAPALFKAEPVLLAGGTPPGTAFAIAAALCAVAAVVCRPANLTGPLPVR